MDDAQNYDIKAGDELDVTVNSDGQEIEATIEAVEDQHDKQGYVKVDMNGTEVYLRFTVTEFDDTIARITDAADKQTIGTVTDLEVA